MTICVSEDVLQAWLDGELAPAAAAEVRLHLARCANCAAQADEAAQAMALLGEAWQAELPEFVPTSRLRVRIEAELSHAPSWLERLRAAFMRWEVAAVCAVLAIAFGAAWLTRRQQPVVPLTAEVVEVSHPTPPPVPEIKALERIQRPRAVPRVRRVVALKQIAFAPVQQLATLNEPKSSRHLTRWEAETNRHLDQTQLLLRAFRNADDGAVTDLAYERELSRELLNRNRLLRRSAEPGADTRAEELLNNIEPLLLDIANLPERVAPDEVRSLKELIREQQMIPALQLYAGKRGY